MRFPLLKVLSEQESKDIHNASIDILVQCGVKILSPAMLDLLAVIKTH